MPNFLEAIWARIASTADERGLTAAERQAWFEKTATAAITEDRWGWLTRRPRSLIFKK